MSRRRRWANVGGLVGIAFLAVMVAWPLVAILDRSFAGVGPGHVLGILGRSSTLRVVAFTAAQAAASVVLTFVFGLPAAHLLARYRVPGRRVINALVLVPFVLPTVVVGAVFRSWFARLGDVGLVGEVPPLVAVLAAHVFFNVAVVVRVVGGYWSSLDPSVEDAARVLGVSGFALFRRVTLPQLAPVLGAAAFIVFLFCFTSYGIILILGGPSMATVETEIYRYAVFRGEMDVAGALALVQVTVVALLVAVGSRLRARQVMSVGPRTAVVGRLRPIRGVWLRGWACVVFALGGLGLVAPMASVVEQSFRVGGESGGYGFDHYASLFGANQRLPVTAARALAHSLMFAVGAAAVAVVVGFAIAAASTSGGRIGRLAAAVSVLPLGVSAVTLGFGYLLAFAAFDLRRSVWLIPLAHAVVGLPFVLAGLRPAISSIDRRLRAAAATLGASPAQTIRRVEWPLLRRACATGAGFAAAISIGEFGATSFLARSESSFTAPMAVYRLLSLPGDQLRGQALALSVVIGAVVATISLVVDRSADRGLLG